MELELDPNTAPFAENDEDSASLESTLINIKGLRIEELLHKDQLDGINSFADTKIACEDGLVPFHRYILMAASSWLYELLINEDPSELTVIHIPDAKVLNVVQVLNILYSGETLYEKSDSENIYTIFQMLGVSTDGLQFRNSKPEDGTILRTLRFYEKEYEPKEKGFIPNIIHSDSPESTTTSQFVNRNLSPVSVMQENVDQLDEMGNEIFPHGSKSVGKGSKNEEPKTKGRKRVKNRTKKPKHSGGKRKAAIHIVDVRELGKKEDVVENINGNERQIEMEVTKEQQHIHEIEEEDDDVVFEEEIIHPSNSKKPRCEPPSSSAASSSSKVMHSEKPVVTQDLENQEEIEYEIENDPSGCCKDISKMPDQDLRLLMTTCPVCKKRCIKMKAASKCLRTHGFRRCWICLKLVPSNDQDFFQHNLKHIIPGTEVKVLCSFCGKPYGYNTGINIHMGTYHFSRLLETTTEDLDNDKSLSETEIKTLETLNRGLANEKVPKNSTPANSKEQSNGKIVEEIVTSEESDECETISSDGDDPDFVPTVRNLEFIGDIEQMPKTRNSLLAEQKLSSIPSTVTYATNTSSPPTPPPVKPANLGRVLLETKEIDGQMYDIYGPIQATSTDPKNKFSKVIAIRNTDVKTSSTEKTDVQ